MEKLELYQMNKKVIISAITYINEQMKVNLDDRQRTIRKSFNRDPRSK